MNARGEIDGRRRGAAAAAGGAPDLVDWPRIERELAAEGHAVLPRCFDEAQVQALRAGRGVAARGASLFEDASCAEGCSVPLSALWPGFLVRSREALSHGLEPIAARWRAWLAEAQGDRRHTESEGPEEGARAAIEADPFSRSHLLLLRTGQGRLLRSVAEDDAMRHPFLLVALLSEPGRDFTGGDLVLTEQRPRMQSRAIVLPLRQGDAAIVAAGPRPCQGTRGMYRAHLRHAVGTVRSGERLGLWMRLDGG